MSILKLGFKKEIADQKGNSYNFWAIMDFHKSTNIFLPTDLARVWDWKIVLKPYKNVEAFLNTETIYIPEESLRKPITIGLSVLELDGGGTIDLTFDRIKNNVVNTFFADAEIVSINTQTGELSYE